MYVHIVAIYVDDQEKAKDFYVNKLGFKLKQDADYGNGTRWLTVTSIKQPEIEIQLALPELPEQREAQQAAYKAGRPFMSFVTDDLEVEYETLKNRGVSFRSEPQEQPYGGKDAVLDDTCGNILNLHQASR